MAVITEVPTPTTVRIVPSMVMTPVVPDEYASEPATESVTPGGVTVKAESPKDLLTLLQAEKVGVALLNVNVAVVVAASKFAEAAFVMVNVQVPEVEALSVDPLNEQPVAVPFATEEIDSAPSPLPPVTEFTDNDVCENGNVLLEALNTGEEIAV